MVMGRRVIDGPDRSRLLIDVPTGILIDIRSSDITPAIGSVSFPTFTGTSPFQPPITTMPRDSSDLARSRVPRPGTWSAHQTARRSVQRRGETPMDFNVAGHRVRWRRLSCL